ncbi:MAG: NAD(P)-dependent oxidoreductase [Verrucomicrobia bacterium]|nr:NAD(P)-dependent oxidoreductase [Verrucomicrobiota bacterium]
MTPTTPTGVPFKPKHAWQRIPRLSPPKRPAAERVGDFREIDLLFDEGSIREQASRCLQCPEPLCRTGCPLKNRIPEWIALAAEGRFLEAAAVSNLTSNMPEICSRVCPQERLCEGACILNARSAPVAIGAVEKFINEYALARGMIEILRGAANGRRVAVVGSGPGGMACADELVKRGYAVVVFESLAIPGGLLVNGIPAFKLEKAVVERRIKLLRESGVDFRLGVTVGRDVSLGALRSDFDAVFLAFGAQYPKPLGVPGAELAGVFDALPFLIQKNVGGLGGSAPIDVEGKRVAVVGGGDTAMDCLRTAVRCGAREAVCVYRRDLANMPGSRKEYQNALEEGARFLFLTNPVAVEGDASGHVTQVRCVQMELGQPDASGRRRPKPVPGSDFVVPAEAVLVAFGFDPVPLPSLDDLVAIAANDWGGVVVDQNQMTNLPGVFAGGDLVRGPSLVVHAVVDGRRAAEGIDRYLSAQSNCRPTRSELAVCQP